MEAADGTPIKLLGNIDATAKPLVVQAEAVLDLNGYDITGNITVNEDKILYCMDTKTDDCIVDDADGYGKISATISEGSVIKALPQGSNFAESGRKEVRQTNLDYCLSQQNWDVISLQEGTSSIYKTGVQEHLAKAKPQLDDLWGYLKEQFPMSRNLWHAPWSYQIGFDKNGYAMETPEQQSSNIKTVREFGQEVCKLYDLELVNTGDAWQIVRDGGYDNLCARKSVNNGEGDYYHDGDIGGGQYLNACVWFEIITGQSCVGNTFRPKYDLDPNITYEALQQAAHQAVESLKNA